MPFIGDRYYMNPLFGAAVERSRQEPEGLPDENAASAAEVELLAGEKTPQTAQGKAAPVDHRGKAPKHFSGKATYYDLPESKTASGHPFIPNEMSAAMTGEKARLGQTVTVTYSHQDAHGKPIIKAITVVVDDRGPFARNADGKPIHPLRPDPRGVIDLTPAAFKELTGSLKQGRVPVTVTVPNEQ